MQVLDSHDDDSSDQRADSTSRLVGRESDPARSSLAALTAASPPGMPFDRPRLRRHALADVARREVPAPG